MKKLVLSGVAAVAAMLVSCSTTQLAQQGAENDDVYNSQAKAKEVQYVRAPEKDYRTDEQLYGGSDYSNEYTESDEDIDYDFDYGYASRINRFQYGTPYRSYYNDWYTYSYDPWYGYGYDPFFYNPMMFRPGFSMWFGLGSFGGAFGGGFGYNPWYGYGSPYYGNYWGPVSYYGGYPGYGYGGGYYGGGGAIVNRTNKPRPYVGSGSPSTRAGSSRVTRPVGYGNNGRVSGVDGRTTRTARPVNGGSTGRVGQGATSTRRPVREAPATQSQPTRVERTEREPSRNTSPSYEPSTRSSSGSSSGSSRSSGGSSSGGGSSRPARR